VADAAMAAVAVTAIFDSFLFGANTGIFSSSLLLHVPPFNCFLFLNRL
jgi:hypothetical protein